MAMAQYRKTPVSRDEKAAIVRDNIVKLRHDVLDRAIVWESRPFFLDMASNNICNLRCKMCSPDARPKTEQMSADDIRMICSQVLPTATVLTPSIGGEPLLGDIEVMVEQCRLYCVKMNLITNATLLDIEKYRNMRDVLKVLHISFDSHVREIYEDIRTGADYDEVVNVIGEVCEASKEDGNEILLSSVIMKDNVRLLPEFVDFAADIGADSVELQRLFHTVPEAAEMDAFGNVAEEEIAALHEAALKRARERGLNVYSYIYGFKLHANNPAKAKKYNTFELYDALADINSIPACVMMTYYVQIRPDAKVLPCCFTDHPVVMGNALKQPFDAIWNGKAYRNLRRQLFTGKFCRACRDCEYRKRFDPEGVRKNQALFYKQVRPYQPDLLDP